MLKRVKELERKLRQLDREYEQKKEPYKNELETIRKSCSHKKMPDTDGPDVCPRCGLTSYVAFLV